MKKPTGQNKRRSAILATLQNVDEFQHLQNIQVHCTIHLQV